MLRAFASSLLSLLLTATLLWGGCVSCEHFFMSAPQAKDCCSPDGHCKTKQAPAKHTQARDCNQIVLEQHQNPDLQIVLPVDPSPFLVQPVRVVNCFEPGRILDSIDSSPPDFQILHSTFLV
jgi:hypothetical protein